MRIITQSQAELIDALLAEKDVGGLTAAILEKDIHVTEALQMLANFYSPQIGLVFCGGTSLSKAHLMIERMSEDVDLKMVFEDGNIKSRNAIKVQLGRFKKNVIAAMEQLGFVPDETGFTTLNENRYFSTTWLYQSRYATDFSLRPHLRLEFTLRVPVCPPKPISMTYLVYQKAEILEGRFSIMCVTIEEILAEKVLSFLRRHAQHRSGHMQQWDTALVRHIYDVFCIVTADANAVTKAKWHFKDLVKFDVLELSQHDEFVEDPRECLRNALTVAELEEQTKNEYQTKLLPLIYGENRPDFVDAFNVFKHCAIALIDTL